MSQGPLLYPRTRSHVRVLLPRVLEWVLHTCGEDVLRNIRIVEFAQLQALVNHRLVYMFASVRMELARTSVVAGWRSSGLGHLASKGYKLILSLLVEAVFKPLGPATSRCLYSLFCRLTVHEDIWLFGVDVCPFNV